MPCVDAAQMGMVVVMASDPPEDLDPMLTGNHDPAIHGEPIDHWPMGDGMRVEF